MDVVDQMSLKADTGDIIRVVLGLVRQVCQDYMCAHGRAIPVWQHYNVLMQMLS